MTRLLLDTSVLIKWFHSEGEDQAVESRTLRSAHVRHDITVHVIDLACYEVGNMLARGLGWRSVDIADQIDDLVTILGPPITLDPPVFRRAAELTERHGLSFYDASWAACASHLGLVLVTADRRLLSAGLGESPAATVQRLRLR